MRNDSLGSVEGIGPVINKEDKIIFVKNTIWLTIVILGEHA
jgi:hypothetical protein